MNNEDNKPHWFTETDIFKEHLKRYNITIENFTCNTCGAVKNCEFAFDLYNTNGDCLGMK